MVRHIDILVAVNRLARRNAHLFLWERDLFIDRNNPRILLEKWHAFHDNSHHEPLSHFKAFSVRPRQDSERELVGIYTYKKNTLNRICFLGAPQRFQKERQSLLFEGIVWAITKHRALFSKGIFSSFCLRDTFPKKVFERLENKRMLRVTRHKHMVTIAKLC